MSLAAKDAQTLFMEGMSFESSLNIFEARDHFAEAVNKAPNNTGYQEHYAWFLNEYGFSEEAETAFLQLIKATPTDSVYHGLGWNQLAVGHMRESLDTYRHVFLDTPQKTSETLEITAIRRRLSDENNTKISELQIRLSQSKNDLFAKKELFRTYAYQGMWVDAERIGKQIRNEVPHDTHFNWEFARMLYWSQQFERADIEFAAMASIHPDNAFILWEWAKVQSARNKFKEARGNLETALKLAPGTPEIVKDLAELYARQGNDRESLLLAQSLYLVRARHLTASLTEARCYHFMGDYHNALIRYNRILEKYPANIEALWGVAEISINCGRIAETMSAISRFESINKNDPRLYILREKLKSIKIPQMVIQTDLYGNSNKYSRLNSGFSTKWMFWPGLLTSTGYTFSRFSESGYTPVTRQSLFIQTEKKFPKIISVTGVLEENIYDNQQNHLNVRLSAESVPNQSNVVKLSYDHIDIIDIEPSFGNQLYNPVVSIGAVKLKITTNDYSVYMHSEPLKEVAFWGKFIYGEYSDGNRKLSTVIGADYSTPLFPALTLSYSFFYLDYSKMAPEGAYYDPSNFLSHAVGVAYRNKSGFWNYGGEWQVNYLQRSNGVGDTLSGFAGLALGDAQELRSEARYFYQNKGENRNSTSGHFSAQQILLSYVLHF
jgi:tetratricopeptide (TPR) repeat protein